MAELARGSVADRPWGRTFAILGLRGVTGQLILVSGGKRFLVAFDQGAVVAAASPRTSDAAVRVALTNHLVSSSQVSEIARRLASAPERDEISVIAELARLGPEHALRLRRRVIAQRAAGTFSIDHGEFTITDGTELTILGGCELDVRAVVYLGARANLSEARLSAEVDQLGAWFRLKPGIDDDLPQFGFTDVEQPVVERLRDGGTLAEIEDFATSFVDGRTVRAVVYALAACSACDVEPPRSRAPSIRAPSSSPSPSPSADQSQPVRAGAQALPRTVVQPAQGAGTQPLPRTGPRPAPPDMSRLQRPASGADRSASPRMQAASPSPPSPPIPEAVIPSKTTTRRSMVPPPPQSPSLATGSTALRPPAEDFEGPTWRDAEGGSRPREPGARDALQAPGSEVPVHRSGERRARRPSGDMVPRENSNAALRLPVREALGLGTTSGSFHVPGDEPARRDSASGPLRLPADEAPRPDGAAGRARRASEAVVRRDGSGSVRLPADEPPGPEAGGRTGRPGEAAKRDGASGATRLPTGGELPRDGSSGSIPLPPDEALRDGASSGDRLGEDGRGRDGRDGSSAGLRLPQEPEAGPGLVVRRVTAARSGPGRQVARIDTPQSHGVKALIAQRLKLLDAGADHFQLLGVSQDAGPEALRRAYFALARQLHPDRLAALGISDDGKHAQRLFAQINAGFATLSDPGRRAAYLEILRRGGEAAVRAEQARAEELARRILEAEEAFRRGELALRRDQPSAAVAELERAVQLSPDETDYHAALAWSRFCAAADKQAVAAATRTALEAAIQRAPRSVTARFYLGRVERMLGRDQDALRQFRDVLAAAPGHAEAAAEVRALEARLPGGDRPGAGRPRR